MKKLIPFLKPYRLQLAVGPVFKLAEAVLEILVPTLMAYLIDNGVNKGNSDYVIKMGLFMFFIATCGVLFAYVCQYSASIASQGFGTDVRNALFRKIESLSHAQIDKLGTVSLVNRITGDVNQLQGAVAMLIRLVIRAPFLCIGGLVMAMSIDLKLSIIFMAVIPLFIITLFLVMTKAVPLYKLVQKKLDHLTLVLRESLSGVRVIRAFAKEENEKQRFFDANTSYADTAIKVGKIAALTNPATTIIMNLAIIAVIWFGGFRVETGNMTQGEIIAFINYLTQILNAMIVVANLVVLYTKAYASALRVNEILMLEPEITDGKNNKKVNTNAPEIEFKNVSFKYNGSGEESISNISFTAKKGETIGIIGGTGSGKSTLVNLIPRFYDIEKGEILLGGVNVKDMTLADIRSKIGIVPQKAVLFRGTVKDNMLFGNENATDEEIASAIKTAQAEEFIEKMPYGYESEIVQGGLNLSGGQKQRLTIARALVKNPDILILDDSSSALDYVTDSKLRKALKEENADRTVIIVSQRVNSVCDADKILVLDDGNLAGIGTHKELLESCELYNEICTSQKSSDSEA